MTEETNWNLKDLRIVRQNALNRAVEITIARAENLYEEKTIQTIKEIADIFVHYIWFGLPNGLVTNDMTEAKKTQCKINEPDIFEGMNKQQQAIFVKIADEYEQTFGTVNKLKLKEEIIKQFGRLPTVENGIRLVLEKIKYEDIKGIKL